MNRNQAFRSIVLCPPILVMLVAIAVTGTFQASPVNSAPAAVRVNRY